MNVRENLFYVLMLLNPSFRWSLVREKLHSRKDFAVIEFWKFFRGFKSRNGNCGTKRFMWWSIFFNYRSDLALNRGRLSMWLNRSLWWLFINNLNILRFFNLSFVFWNFNTSFIYRYLRICCDLISYCQNAWYFMLIFLSKFLLLIYFLNLIFLFRDFLIRS